LFEEPKIEYSQNVSEESSETLKKASKTTLVPGELR